MGLFERKISTEPPMVTPDEVKVADLDDKLAAIAEIPRDDRSEGLVWQENQLLDRRNKIRPGKPRPVPVVPGRVDSIIDNYWENPW
jgi:hypothetical protein